MGTELLFGQIADTNAQHLGQLLPELGIHHYFRQTVGDNLDRVIQALKLALSRADIVFTIGGLGPTQDDLTRDGIAAALGEELVADERIAATLRTQFELRKLTWTENQNRQAMRPPCAKPIENPNGTAPGLICEKDNKVVIALPGPRGEFVPMIDGPVREYLAKDPSEEVFHSRLLKICGLGESLVETRIKSLLSSTNPTVAPYAKLGEVHLRVTARAPNIQLAEMMIEPVETRIREALGKAVFGADEATLEYVTLDLLKVRNQTVAVAESITGGGLGSRMSAVPGASDVFVGGIISYSKEVKAKELGVDRKLLDNPNVGPVSAEVATEMAVGVRDRLRASYGVSLTGNAGPTSDDGDKPIGLNYIGVAGPNGVRVEEYRFRGTREDIRYRASQAALTLLREILLTQ